MEQIAGQATHVAGTRSLYGVVKRVFDIVIAVTLLVVMSPILLAVGIAVVIDSGLPALYRCQRLGRGGGTMTMLKFRTMLHGSHHHLAEILENDEERQKEYWRQRKLKDDPRRTRVGAFLRRTSLDELPQLWNIVRGQMSFVGPRPYFVDELDGRPEKEILLSVRPGLTGLWQVNGRSDRTFEERIILETEYARKVGPLLDLRIMIRTAGAVLSGRGAY